NSNYARQAHAGAGRRGLGAGFGVRDRKPQCFAFGATAVLQVEANVAHARGSRLHRSVDQTSERIKIVNADLDRVRHRVAARYTLAVDEVDFLLQVDAQGTDCVGGNLRVTYRVLHA